MKKALILAALLLIPVTASADPKNPFHNPNSDSYANREWRNLQQSHRENQERLQTFREQTRREPPQASEKWLREPPQPYEKWLWEDATKKRR
jgi:hypothetical protein